jgi:hypothetical protein
MTTGSPAAQAYANNAAYAHIGVPTTDLNVVAIRQAIHAVTPTCAIHGAVGAAVLLQGEEAYSGPGKTISAHGVSQ